jgi:peptidoglycan/LPS O-acetylase OafA/YrhL
MNRIPSLDGLRAISILMVVIGHLAESEFRSQTAADVAAAFANLGVRIFFVISGYLITKLLLNEESRTGGLNLRAFYTRRAYRILPAATFFMVAVFVIFRHQLHWYDVAAAVLYLTNYDYASPWFLKHLWSLSVEEQFYLLWPSILKKWILPRQRTHILLAVIAFAPIYRVLCHLLQLRGHADGSFPAVSDVLAIGCLLAIFESRLLRISPRLKALQLPPSMLLTGLMILALLCVPVYWGMHGLHLTLPLLFLLWPVMHLSIAGLLLRAVQSPGWILNSRPAVWLGKISYSLYLWQQLFVYGKHVNPWYGTVLALGMANLSYYVVERSALRLREKRPNLDGAKIVVSIAPALFPLATRSEP